MGGKQSLFGCFIEVWMNVCFKKNPSNTCIDWPISPVVLLTPGSSLLFGQVSWLVVEDSLDVFYLVMKRRSSDYDTFLCWSLKEVLSLITVGLEYRFCLECLFNVDLLAFGHWKGFCVLKHIRVLFTFIKLDSYMSGCWLWHSCRSSS